MKPGNTRAAIALIAAISAGVPLAHAQEDAAKKTATTVCAGCHGADGNSADPVIPKLAGLQSLYLAKQLKDYIAGKRKNDAPSACGKDLDANLVSGLAAYFSDQKAAPGKPGDPGLAAAGKKVYDQGNSASGVDDCQECHKPDGKGSGLYARVAGQHAAYVVKQLTAFKTHKRNNDKNEVMHEVAEKMTEQEIRAVAEYMAGM